MTSLTNQFSYSNIYKFIKILLFGGMLLGFYLYIPVEKLFTAIRSANFLYFVAALLLSFIVAFLTTLSTWILATKQGIQIPLGEFYLFNLAIRFYSFFSPASAVSTAMRWHKLSIGGKSAEALSAISSTRILSITIAVCLGFYWIASKVNKYWLNAMFFIGLIVVLISGWLLITRLSHRLSELLMKRSDAITHSFIRKIVKFLSRYLDSMVLYSRMSYMVLCKVALIHLGLELLGIVSHILLARALGIQLSIYDMGLLRAIAFLSALTPFTLVGGIGIREVSLVIAMSAFNVGPDLAAAFSFLVYARGAVFSLLCGILELISITRST
jgi:uncharacterized protein (TIRG00374 family)